MNIIKEWFDKHGNLAGRFYSASDGLGSLKYFLDHNGCTITSDVTFAMSCPLNTLDIMYSINKIPKRYSSFITKYRKSRV